MDAFIEFLVSYGYLGMFISAFIAGSFLPFSSEAVMMGLIAAGLNPMQLLVYATIGNWGGSMFNYGVGRLGKLEWIERYLNVKKEKLDKAQRFMGDRGAWMGIFSFLPIIGTAICIALGLMRSNLMLSSLSIFIGKLVRYVIIAYSSMVIF